MTYQNYFKRKCVFSDAHGVDPVLVLIFYNLKHYKIKYQNNVCFQTPTVLTLPSSPSIGTSLSTS